MRRIISAFTLFDSRKKPPLPDSGRSRLQKNSLTIRAEKTKPHRSAKHAPAKTAA